MTAKIKEVKYIECDGCGYSINEDHRHTKLELAWTDEEHSRGGTITLHFHAEGTHDCLRYWLGNQYTVDRTLSAFASIPAESVEKILTTLSHRKTPDKAA